MRKILLATFILVFGVTAFAQTVLVHDPTKKWKEYDGGEKELEFIVDNVFKSAKAHWKGDRTSESLQIIGKANGSFTKKGAKQTAYLYEFAQTGNGLSQLGIAVFEKGKIIKHDVFEGGWATEFDKVADANKNGLDEMAVNWSGGMRSGKIGSATAVFEEAPKGLKLLYIGQSSWSDCDGDTSTIDCGYSYKITAKAGAKPVLYQKKMTGGEGKKWRNVGKAKVAKPIDVKVNAITVR